MMRLKHRDELTEHDLPDIESAFFARGRVEHASADRFNLNWFLRDPLGCSGGLSERELKQRVRARLERYDIVLLGDPPSSPVFRRSPNGGAWTIRGGPHDQFYLESLLNTVQWRAAGETLRAREHETMVAGLGGKILQGVLKGSKKDGKTNPPDNPAAKPPAPTPRSHADVLGKSDGGPGKWEKAPKRTKGEEYQEQVSGVERGVEYNVNGVKFDGYDPKRKVLLDAKDWEKFPPEGTDFWGKNVRKEASDQVKAASGTGAKIEWHVSTQEKAQAAKKFLQSENMYGDNGIRVVYTPKP